MNALIVAKSAALFLLAGFCEIGGGYLVWQWWRKGAPLSIGLLGAVLLIVYGILPAFQPTGNFGRVYAAYGGVFIIMSLLWDWRFDGRMPDKADCWGALLCLIGVAVIMYWPRGAAAEHPLERGKVNNAPTAHANITDITDSNPNNGRGVPTDRT